MKDAMNLTAAGAGGRTAGKAQVVGKDTGRKNGRKVSIILCRARLLPDGLVQPGLQYILVLAVKFLVPKHWSWQKIP